MYALFLRLVGSGPQDFKPVAASESKEGLEKWLEEQRNVIEYPGATQRLRLACTC